MQPKEKKEKERRDKVKDNKHSKEDFDLVAAMESFRDDPTKHGRRRFFQALKHARLLVPYQGDAMNVAALHNTEGEILLPVFTSQYELTRAHTAWDHTGTMTLDDLKHILIDLPAEVTGVVLNPFGTALVLRRSQLLEIDREMEGMTLQRTDHPVPQILAPLKSYPAGIVEALRCFFAKNREVTRAWILAARPDYKTAPHKLFVIEFFGDRRMLFPQVAKVIEPFMKPGESFELMKADLALAREANEKSTPIYVC